MFLRCPHKLFQFNTHTAITEGTNQTLAWAIILKKSDDAHIGFRAAKTYGPFESELGADGLVRQGNLSIAVIQSLELA